MSEGDDAGFGTAGPWQVAGPPAVHQPIDGAVLRVVLPVVVRRPPPTCARRLRVHTSSGAAYLLDPSTMTATRLRRIGTADPAAGVVLRRDGEPLDLWAWPVVKVGLPLQMLLSVREDTGDPTIRCSTPVTIIELQ